MEHKRTFQFFLSAIPAVLILVALGLTINTASAALSGEGIQNELLAVAAPRDLACPVGTIAYWQLEESEGPYLDSYGDHDGVHTGTPPSLVSGVFGNAQNFKGTTTGIDVPSHSDFDWGASDSFTIEAWAKPNVGSCLSNSRVVVGRDDGSGVQWWIGCEAVTGAATFQLDDSDTVRLTVYGANITDGLWHHIVGVRDGPNNVNYLFVDNVMTSLTTEAYTGDFIAVAPANINFGWINHREDLPVIHRFFGVIDEVAIYDRALTAAEVASHFSGGEGGTAQPYCVDAPTDIYLPVVFK